MGIRISELPPLDNPQPDDTSPVVSAGVTEKSTTDKIVNAKPTTKIASGSLDETNIADNTIPSTSYNPLIAFSFWKSDSPDIQHDTKTIITFQEEAFNFGGAFDMKWFTAPVDGIYNFGYRSSVLAVPIDKRRYGYISLDDDSDYMRTITESEIANPDDDAYLTTMMYLEAGRKICFKIYHNSGTAKQLRGGEPYTWAWGYLVGQV